jgi:hypothetical protein
MNNMNATRLKNNLATWAAVLTATTDQFATAARQDKRFTGQVVSVDPKENRLKVKGFIRSKTFNLGTACGFILPDESTGTANDLRPGEKVTVSYQNVHNVLIASRVEQQPMRLEGIVEAINPDKRTLTLHRPALSTQFQIADGCNIVLRDGKPGAFADIQPGSHVTVTYETPDAMPTVREITKTSLEFTGTLTAIDLGEKTVKASALLGSVKFNVAGNCAIVINGRINGQLGDLKPYEKLVFSYDEINGINVVKRIAPVEAQPESVADISSPMIGDY